MVNSRLTPISVDVVHDFVNKVEDWPGDWISAGSNHFIHAELYSKKLPDCVQDTFTCLSTHLSRTEKTRSIVHRLIEAKANKFVTSQASADLPTDTLTISAAFSPSLSTPSSGFLIGISANAT